MNMKRKIKEERIKYTNFTNQTTNKTIAYSNILTEGCTYPNDDGITNFFMIDYINFSSKTKIVDKESFI